MIPLASGHVETHAVTPEITRILHPLATIWIARERKENASYYYGGTRLVDPSTTDEDAGDSLLRLMGGESGVKNRLIDKLFEEGALDDLGPRLPPGFLDSRVGGARCLIRPRTREIAVALSDPDHPRSDYATAVLRRIGDALNEQERIKLTPDFGRNARFADVLYQHTPNVLGIACERGGCGGKSSYSVTGVLAGVDRAARELAESGRATCIGAAGALGSGVVAHLLNRGARDVAVSDLVYDAGDTAPPSGTTLLDSRDGAFTERCLARGGLIIATTVGDELEKSAWWTLPRGTALFLAHNLALPPGDRGVRLARRLAESGVLAIPGQVLTLGGALTARLEWYWRKLPGSPSFDKALAHEVVGRFVEHLTGDVLELAATTHSTPYEAMLQLASEGAS